MPCANTNFAYILVVYKVCILGVYICLAFTIYSIQCVYEAFSCSDMKMVCMCMVTNKMKDRPCVLLYPVFHLPMCGSAEDLAYIPDRDGSF